MSPPAPPPSSARTGASSAAWVAAKGGEEEVAVPRRVQWKADEGACPHLAPTGFDSNLLLPRFGTYLVGVEVDLSIYLLRHVIIILIQNSTVHNGLHLAVAQDFHVVSYMDMQRMWKLLDHFPAVAVAVNNLQASTTCEQDASRGIPKSSSLVNIVDTSGSVIHCALEKINAKAKAEKKRDRHVWQCSQGAYLEHGNRMKCGSSVVQHLLIGSLIPVSAHSK
ncbi:hypothetical protein ZWY2020_012124 [Hordeum vulgare]|nr:hypothetical protein ZWY2020_012124 [Hordeum vulgare]